MFNTFIELFNKLIFEKQNLAHFIKLPCKEQNTHMENLMLLIGTLLYVTGIIISSFETVAV